MYYIEYVLLDTGVLFVFVFVFSLSLGVVSMSNWKYPVLVC